MFQSWAHKGQLQITVIIQHLIINKDISVYRISGYFRGAKFSKIVLKQDEFIYAIRKFLALVICVIYFERELIFRGLYFRAFKILAKKAKIKYPRK